MGSLRVLLLLSLPGLVIAQVLPPVCPTGTPNPVTWYLSGVRFIDGGTASGSFVYDANNDTHSSINITTSNGSALAGAHYVAFLGTITSCPLMNQLPVVTQTALLNYSGQPTLRLQLLSGSLLSGSGTLPLSTNFSFEGTCGDATCSDPRITGSRFVTAGSVSTTPPPANAVPAVSAKGLLLLTISLALAAVYFIRQRVLD